MHVEVWAKTESQVASALNAPDASSVRVFIVEDLDISGELCIPKGSTVQLNKKMVFKSGSGMDLMGTLSVSDGASLIFEEGSSLTGGGSDYRNSSTILVYNGNFSFYGTHSGLIHVSIDGDSTFEGMSAFGNNVSLSVETDDPAMINTLFNRTDGIRVQLSIRSDLTVTENVTVPSGSNLQIHGNVTFSQDKELIIGANADVFIHNGGTLTASVKNGGWIYIYSDGNLCIPANGAYSGSGTLTVSCSEEEVQNHVSGISLTDFERLGSSTETSQIYRYTSGMDRLATPYDLQWGIDMPGRASWYCLEPNQGRFTIEFYRQGETDPVDQVNYYFPGDPLPLNYSIDSFCTLDAETGDYYFTVTSTSSDGSYGDSETVKSSVWHYERPEAQLGACSNIQISNNGWTYCAPENTTNVGGFQTYFYYAYAAEENDTPCQIGGTSGISADFTCSEFETRNTSVYDSLVQQYGAGYYSFKVRALSKDITAAVNGPWSDMSPAVYIGNDSYTLAFTGGTVEYRMGTTDNRLSATVSGLSPQTYYEKYGSLIWESAAPDVLSFTEEYGWSGTASSVKVNLNGVGIAYVTAATRDGKNVSVGGVVVVHSASPAAAPGKLKTIESEAFRNTNFEEIILQDGVESIGSGAFKDCANLKLITVPDSVTSIADDAFSGCENLTILCSGSSAAASFALENQLPYVTVTN